jgi:hypothetical protein
VDDQHGLTHKTRHLAPLPNRLKQSLQSGSANCKVEYDCFIPSSQREPQPKRLTRENTVNREDRDWKILFSFLISVCSVFSVLKIFAFLHIFYLLET